MKDFSRKNRLFSLCGLNCGLCPMHLGGYCPGCGGGEGNQACAIAKCSIRHGKLEYCFACGEFPCEKYENIGSYDSFITHRNRLRDFDKCREIGETAYSAEQAEKANILKMLLSNYNDGRRKSFYCVAVNLLELEDLNQALAQFAGQESADMTVKDKAARMALLLEAAAVKRDVALKLNKKPKKKG